MVLAAKEDKLPDCVNMPEPQPEPEKVEIEVTDQTEPPVDMLFNPDDFGKPVEKEEKKKEPRTKKVKVTKTKDADKHGFFSVLWTSTKETALRIYDKANEE